MQKSNSKQKAIAFAINFNKKTAFETLTI